MKKTKIYYNEAKYEKANKLFDYFINSCEITTPPKPTFDNFQVSTITCVSTIGQTVNIQKFFELLNVSPINAHNHIYNNIHNNTPTTILPIYKTNLSNLTNACNEENHNCDIIYAKYSHALKGKKKKQKKNDMVRFKGNNQLFTNQMSIGFRCNNKEHLHKNPISVKVFRNGRIQMTGCKNMKEINIMYNKLYNELLKVNKINRNNMNNNNNIIAENSTKIRNNTNINTNNNNIVKNNTKVSNKTNINTNNHNKNHSPFAKHTTHDIVQNILPFDPKLVQIEMINGTFYVNQSLDLNQVLKMFMTEYSHKEVFIIQNKKSPLNLSVKMLGYFDEKKKKDKIPSVFIYNTGAINIIATKKPILIKTYHFIKNNLEKWWDDIVEKKIIYNDNVLENDPLFK